MSWAELIKQGLKAGNKAMIKKGSTVSTKKIDKGIVEFVEPKSKKVTIQSSDGKQRETVSAQEVTVKPVRTRTREESIYTRDRDQPIKRINDFSESELQEMSAGQIRQILIKDNRLQSYKDLAEIVPGDSAAFKKVRYVGQNQVPGLRKTTEDRNKFSQARVDAKKQAEDQKQAEELVARQRDFADKGAKAYEKKHTSRPVGTDPEFQGNFAKLREATQRYNDTGRWAKGGSVKVKKSKKYREIDNKYSSRMLPGKKRTTRIY
tara:strand:- start:215 stop:1003 length:789 start_codon:yes stop_codon:yes gene_type:complete